MVTARQRAAEAKAAEARRAADEAASTAALAAIGIAAGDKVRFRSQPGRRWQPGTVVRREADGSIGVRDERGGLRSLAIELIEVKDATPRGAVRWDPLPERAARTEQMTLM